MRCAATTAWPPAATIAGSPTRTAPSRRRTAISASRLRADRGGEIGLAAALVGYRQRADHELAGDLLRQGLHGGVVEPAIGVAREELVTVDEPGQRARLGPERVDDVAVVDHMAAAVVAIAAAARQGRQMRAAEEDFNPVVVEFAPATGDR